MARKARAVVAGVPHHVTQGSSGGRDLFPSEGDRELYLDLVFRQARRHLVRVWGYCLMRDHVHFLVEPFLNNSLAWTFGRAHADYARYQNLRQQRVERFWKGRFSSCAVAEDQAWAVLAYIENNPVRASLAPSAQDYPWSSARAHCLGDAEPRLELADWRKSYDPDRWRRRLSSGLQDEALRERIREATRAGVPLGSELFIASLGRELGRDLRRKPPGRPRELRLPGVLVAKAG